MYGGVDGLICQDRGVLRPHVPAATAAWSPYRIAIHDDDMETAAYGSAEARASPRFYKLEFATYDGSEDPLNWLNHCEQFFRGQRTPASDRTWLASYHLKGPAQIWYYALEQDEGMPLWDRFAECVVSASSQECAVLALLSLDGYPSYPRSRSTQTASRRCYVKHGTSPLFRRQSCSLAASPRTCKWTSSYASRRTCRRPCTWHGHSSDAQRPCLHLSRAGRSHHNGRRRPAARHQHHPLSRQLVRRPPATAIPRGTPFSPLVPGRATCQHVRRRQGLCFNCDEPYVRGHVCQRLFYLEVDDFSRTRPARVRGSLG